MTKEEITALARKHGTSYTNRHAPGEPAFAFGNVSWVAFCDALVATAQPVQPMASSRRLYEASRDAAVDTLMGLGYEYLGASQWQPPVQPKETK